MSHQKNRSAGDRSGFWREILTYAVKNPHQNTGGVKLLVGLTRVELVTSSLSGMRSNQLSYSPSG